jgi:hypothetical protein
MEINLRMWVDGPGRAAADVDPRVRAAVAEMLRQALEVQAYWERLEEARWWAGTHVAVKRRGTRTYNHPVVGEITLDWDPLTSDADPDQQLII